MKDLVEWEPYILHDFCLYDNRCQQKLHIWFRSHGAIDNDMVLWDLEYWVRMNWRGKMFLTALYKWYEWKRDVGNLETEATQMFCDQTGLLKNILKIYIIVSFDYLFL